MKSKDLSLPGTEASKTPPLEGAGGRNKDNSFYNKNLKEKARRLRNDSTIAEVTLWKYVLRASGLGYPFKRQRPIENYIVDFVSLPLKLVIEVDGITHSYEEVSIKDDAKDQRLKELGFTILRIPDDAILANVDRVRNYLLNEIKNLPFHVGPTSSKGGISMDISSHEIAIRRTKRTDMFDINKITRPNVKALKPYSSARNEFEGIAEVSLDANENPFGFGLNRYPDASLKKLKHAFAEYREVNQNQLIFGNGSDEIIDLLIRAFCEPGKDKLLTFPPTFSMYGVCAAVNDIEEVKVPLNEKFQIDFSEVSPLLSDEHLKLIFVCTPNNPTGNQMDLEVVKRIAHEFSGLVVVDEAYIDFSGGSLVNEDIPNLFILQTFSKTFGLAGARLGVGIGKPEVVNVLNKIKPPYNVNSLTQDKAVEMLERPELVSRQIEILKKEKVILEKSLAEIAEVKKIHPSDANFLLVEFKDAKSTYQTLLEKGIVLRDRSSQVANTLRITIGAPEENLKLIQALKKEQPVTSARIGRCVRATAETKILVEVNLDDPKGSVSATGVAFFDHMLDQIARHGAIGLKVQVEGDIKIDTHHTIEDTALALGTAFNDALKERKGIERYGFLLPMDDSLAQVALDFGGRPWLEWDADFTASQVGEMPTEMVSHFFKSFSDTARCNLNIKVEGDNDHHKIESIFKAFARALKMAVRKDESGLLPSTKGVL